VVRAGEKGLIVSAAAILLVGVSLPGHTLAGWQIAKTRTPVTFGGVPLVSLDVLGSSVVQRTLDRFSQAEITSFSILADGNLPNAGGFLETRPGWSTQIDSLQNELEVWPTIQRAASRLFAIHEQIFLVWLGSYAEFNPSEILQFSRDHDHAPVRVHDRLGPVGVWVLNARSMTQDTSPAAPVKTFLLDGYVNRLSQVEHIRRFASDMLLARCTAKPRGVETRPGVWMDDGAQLHRQARVVPPSYIGKNAKIGADVLITRTTNVERDCTVDYGTVIEDSSILANTYIGMGLDIAHSVVQGKALFHLPERLIVEIDDAILIGTNRPARLRKIRPKSHLFTTNSTKTKPLINTKEVL